MKSILSFLIMLSSFISQEIIAEDIIYIFRRPPFSDAGIIDDDKFYYDFTNARPKECDLKIKNGCFIKTNIRAEVIKKGIIKVGDNFACSREIISQAKGKEDQDFDNEYFFGYGFCTKEGWQKVKNSPLKN